METLYSINKDLTTFSQVPGNPSTFEAAKHQLMTMGVISATTKISYAVSRLGGTLWKDEPNDLELDIPEYRERVRLLSVPYVQNQGLSLSAPTITIDQGLHKPRDGIRLGDPREFISLRSQTLDRIAGILAQKRLMLIRAPPSAGKTSTSFLLADRYRSLGYRIALISFLASASFETAWISRTGSNWTEWLKDQQQPTVVIIDEAQVAFQNPEATSFWQALKLFSINPFQNVSVVVFAAYGSVVSTQLATPIEFPSRHGLDLLLCTDGEATELVDHFHRLSAVRLSERLKNIVYRMTNGHIGLLSYALYIIGQKFEDAARAGMATEVELERYLLSYPFFSSMAQTRASPELSTVSKDHIQILERILTVDSLHFAILSNDDQNHVAALVKLGILYLDNDKVSFSSSMARNVCFAGLFAGRPELELSTLDDFVIAMLQRLSPKFLANSLGNSLDGIRLERVWQMEVYRASIACLPDQTYISPEIGHMYGTAGLVDFYVNDQSQWLIEIIREGDRMAKHHKRFSPGGLYSAIPKKDYAVIDFRQESKAVVKYYNNFWYVLYKPDYSGATVRRCINGRVVSQDIKFVGLGSHFKL